MKVNRKNIIGWNGVGITLIFSSIWAYWEPSKTLMKAGTPFQFGKIYSCLLLGCENVSNCSISSVSRFTN